jgi:hypothetical protein
MRMTLQLTVEYDADPADHPDLTDEQRANPAAIAEAEAAVFSSDLFLVAEMASGRLGQKLTVTPATK